MGIDKALLNIAINMIASNPDILKKISMPNLPTKTMDMGIFWNTIADDHGWRLQQNQITHHVRLLDPDSIRRGWGSEEEMSKLLSKIVK